MEEFSHPNYKQEEDVPIDDHDEDTFFRLSKGFDIGDGNLRAEHEGTTDHVGCQDEDSYAPRILGVPQIVGS